MASFDNESAKGGSRELARHPGADPGSLAGKIPAETLLHPTPMHPALVAHPNFLTLLRALRRRWMTALALGGTLGPGAEDVLNEGIEAIFSLCTGPMSYEEAVGRAPELLSRVSAQVVRCFLAGRASRETKQATSDVSWGTFHGPK